MHRALFLREILLEIFSYVSLGSPLRRRKMRLAALARTCRTFKEPALDVLWGHLTSLSPLARCLPEACEFNSSQWYFTFSRPLTEAEWNTLRGYTHRVRSIYKDGSSYDDGIVSTLAPISSPIFPNLQSLFWDAYTMPPVVHTAVPSLTSLYFKFSGSNVPLPTELLDTFGERCPNVRQFSAFSPPPGPLCAAISRQLCRWTNLQCVYCREVTLSMATILCLPSTPTLTSFSFTLSTDLGNNSTHLGAVLVFPNLADLHITSISLTSVTRLFSRIQLPKIEGLKVSGLEGTSRWDIREYWTTVREACPSNTPTRLEFSCCSAAIEHVPGHDEQSRPRLLLDDLLPYKEFGNLRRIEINLPWSVDLTDTDILDLVSTSPQLKELSINSAWGWKIDGDDGGITLSGLVELLRQCPSLEFVALAIDTWTFANIPHKLDVSFPPRGWRGIVSLDYLDSNVVPELIPDLKSVCATLGLRTYSSYHSDYGSTSESDYMSEDDEDA